MNGLCTPLSPSQQEHSRPRGMCGTGVCRKKAPPGKKPVAEHATLLRRRLQRKKSPQAPLPPPEARGMRVSAGKNSRIQVAETLLCPESRKTSRGSPTAQGKNWPWKRMLTRCAGSPHDTGKKKRPAPVSHGRSEGDFPRFCVTPRQGNAEIRQIIPADAFGSRENSAQAEVRQAVSSGRKFPPAGMP